MALAIRIGFVLALVWAGWSAYRMFRTGTIRVFDMDEPVRVIARQDKPLAYWAFIMLFYSVLIAVAVGAMSL